MAPIYEAVSYTHLDVYKRQAQVRQEVVVANEADIAITSSNSLTVAVTLEAAKRAVVLMGATDLTQGKVLSLIHI